MRIGNVVLLPIHVKKDKGIVTATLIACQGYGAAVTIVKINLEQDHLLGIAALTAASMQPLQLLLKNCSCSISKTL